VGDPVEKGAAVCTVYAESETAADEAVKRLSEAFVLAPAPPEEGDLILDELSAL
jgi:thymidine phosphorylase